MTKISWGALLALPAAAAIAVACGSNAAPSTFTSDDQDAGACPSCVDLDATLSSEGSPSGDAAAALTIAPADAVLTVNLGGGQAVPTQQFTAFSQGAQVPAQWTVDRGEIAAIGVSSGLLTPTTNVAGKATVTATYGGRTASTSITVKIVVAQAGDPNAPSNADAGAGGYLGVGGDGEGAAANAAQIALLNGAATADANVSFLYPYDKTVWPRGTLPPLLQWTVGAHQFDALYIHVTEANFEYKGYFQKPAGANPFQNHPIPKDVWKQLAYSNAGEDVTVSLTFAESAQNKVTGPIVEHWKIANGTLKGTVYYNSYGTGLAVQTNFTAMDGEHFGGGTLAIRGGSLAPTPVAGTNGDSSAQCRVCHSVSANGATLVTQHGDAYGTSSAYDLKNGNTESAGWASSSFPALYPDGTFLLTSTTSGASALTDLTAGNLGKPIAANGLTFSAFTPAFSPDGAHVAYDDYGTGKLTIADFAAATKALTNARALFTPSPDTHAYWPSFMPTNDAIVFEVETVYNGRDVAGTRSRCEDPSGTNPCGDQGTHAELWWVDLKTPPTAHRLDQANGVGYLPTHASAYHDSTTDDRGKDAEFNYEPTVNPVPSGGYAWVVFTSRRVYGNVATVNPFWSDPRFRKIGQQAAPKGVATTKKLWVAAIDLNAPPGTDPSHPAFYLPAQELYAGNARGFWVVDPCHQDGASCETGDECCGGFCRPGGDAGGLVCTAQQPSCSQEFEKCNVTADCCGASMGYACINGRCAQPAPR